jgi:uncharacterized protein (DUF362 family)
MNNPSNVYCESGKGPKNLADALQAQLRDINIRGKTILLKPNMVDPDIPEACSNPASLRVIADALTGHGAAKIFLGDEPASYYINNVKGGIFNVMDAYAKLGYGHIPGTELLDLSTMPVTSYSSLRVNPLTGTLSRRKVPVRDISGLFVVSTTLPKQHGNFNYTGVTKNLMGLVPAQDRMDNFHYSIGMALEEEWKKGNTGLTLPAAISKFASEYSKLSGGAKEGFFAPVYKRWLSKQIDDESMIAHIDHIVNAFSIIWLADFVKAKSRQGLYVLDGTYTMEKHEHEGSLVKTDFAMVGQSPIHVDMASLAKLGLDIKEVPYLAIDAPYQSAVEYTKRMPIIQGDLGAPMEKASLIEKEIFTDRHGLTFCKVK